MTKYYLKKRNKSISCFSYESIFIHEWMKEWNKEHIGFNIIVEYDNDYRICHYYSSFSFSTVTLPPLL